MKAQKHGWVAVPIQRGEDLSTTSIFWRSGPLKNLLVIAETKRAAEALIDQAIDRDAVPMGQRFRTIRVTLPKELSRDVLKHGRIKP